MAARPLCSLGAAGLLLALSLACATRPLDSGDSALYDSAGELQEEPSDEDPEVGPEEEPSGDPEDDPGDSSEDDGSCGLEDLEPLLDVRYQGASCSSCPTDAPLELVLRLHNPCEQSITFDSPTPCLVREYSLDSMQTGLSDLVYRGCKDSPTPWTLPAGGSLEELFGTWSGDTPGETRLSARLDDPAGSSPSLEFELDGP